MFLAQQSSSPPPFSKKSVVIKVLTCASFTGRALAGHSLLVLMATSSNGGVELNYANCKILDEGRIRELLIFASFMSNMPLYWRIFAHLYAL